MVSVSSPSICLIEFAGAVLVTVERLSLEIAVVTVLAWGLREAGEWVPRGRPVSAPWVSPDLCSTLIVQWVPFHYYYSYSYIYIWHQEINYY